MSKKRARESTNPLAHARKSENKAESLWLRKTGAGFRLFAEYYEHQPMGVCSDGSPPRNDDEPGINLLHQQHSLSQDGRKGESRASIRRRKKKKRDGGGIQFRRPANRPLQPTLSAIVSGDERLTKIIQDLWNSNSHIYEFLRILAKPLPLTFRVRQSLPAEERSNIRDHIEQRFRAYVAPTVYDSDIFNAVSEVCLSKGTLAATCPTLKDFLIKGSTEGVIARQELASMLPVLALSRGGWLSQKNCRVLDLCASPGSKTLQALEVIGGVRECRIKANDVNTARLVSLKEAIGRSGISPEWCKAIKLTSLDASKYPIPLKQQKLFDAVICDVPCSGDGTIRKDPHILPCWTPAAGNALHRLQVSILLRALQCLRVNGVVSYSTCSLNPVEDEAVVASALLQFQRLSRKLKCNTPPAEILKWPEFEGLSCAPGVVSWKVGDFAGDSDEADEEHVRLRWYSTHEDAVEANMKHAIASLWPPDEAKSLSLDRCIRLWPHANDTGGFFVALIRRNW